MNELQPVQRDHSVQPASGGLVQDPVRIEMPGPGLKRDYAGILEYWQMIRRHKGAVIIWTFLGVLTGFLITLPAPRIYQASTTMEIQSLNEDFLDMRNTTPVADGSSGYDDVALQTQVKILQSNLLLSRARTAFEQGKPARSLQPPDRLGMWRKALGLNPESAETLWQNAIGMAAGSVRVRSSPNNRIIEISCDSTDAQVAAGYCNTLTREYIDQSLEARWKTTEYTGQWLTRQLLDLKVKLEKSQEELATYASATGLVFTDDKKDVQDTKLGDLQKELSTAQADRINKQSRYEMAVASPTAALPDVLDDSSLKGSQSALAELKAKLAQLRVTFTPNHVEVKRAEAQIAAIEGSLQGAGTNVLTRMRQDYESAKRRETLLADAYATQTRFVSGQAEQAAHYGVLKGEVEASRLLYESLTQRLKEASISAALRANNVRVVDAAVTPGSPYKPDVSERCTAGLFLGLALGIGFVVFRERADRTLQDPGDISFFLSVPELGVIPVGELDEISLSVASKSLPAYLKDKGPQDLANGESPRTKKDAVDRVELVSWNQRASLVAESFRTTLTSILFSRRGAGQPKILVFTSASPKEGKTTVVSNIGIALAEINQTVLLIDADMRRPRLHSVFSVENTHGLSDLLQDRVPLDAARLEEACWATAVPGLFVLPSGSSRQSASSLLHSPRLAELLSLAREKFDMVVVDTPPMVNISDARVVARFGDALILVVRSGTTSRDAALLAQSRFAEDGIPLLGTILNFWNPKTPGYSYYKYYYAGYYHYYGDGKGKGNGNGNGEGGGADQRSPDDQSGERPRWVSRMLRPGLDAQTARESET